MNKAIQKIDKLIQLYKTLNNSFMVKELKEMKQLIIKNK